MKGKIKSSNIYLVNSKNIFQTGKALFHDKDGQSVYSGDTVKFYIENEVYPSSGTVSNLKSLRIDTFNTLLNKWEYYLIECENH